MNYREHFSIDHLKNGELIHYKTTESGTVYHEQTPDNLVALLERIRENGTRVTFDWGNPETGESWHEVYDITGTIGRSSGHYDRHWPLLIKQSRSTGGGMILDHCIISIKHANKRDGGLIYKTGVVEITK